MKHETEIYLYEKYKSRPYWMIVAVIFGILSLYSKYFFILVILPLIFWYFDNNVLVINKTTRRD